MRTTQIAQYALRLTYSQTLPSTSQGTSHSAVMYTACQRLEYPETSVTEEQNVPANREKMMSRSALFLAALGLGLSTFSVRQMILHQSRRF